MKTLAAAGKDAYTAPSMPQPLAPSGAATAAHAGTAKSGFVGVVGLPNAGKSTLVNFLLGKHIAAVSPLPQTTRQRVVAVRNLPGAQIAYVDTPGIQNGRGALRKFMQQEAVDAAGSADVALLVVDALGRRAMPEAWLGSDSEPLCEAVAGMPVVVALNKIDRIEKPELLPLLSAWSGFDRLNVQAVVPIAANRGEGVEAMERELVALLAIGAPMFPPDVDVDRADEFIAAELIREQVFAQLRDELPYTTAVVVESLTDQGEDVVISALVIVERDSQKGIIIGKGGQQLGKIGERARRTLSATFGCAVHLKLFVKVMPLWTENDRSLLQLGLSLGKGRS